MILYDLYFGDVTIIYFVALFTHLNYHLIFIYGLILLKIDILYFQSIKSEYHNYHSINSDVRMENIIFFMLKMNTLAVFHSHWFNFSDMKPLIFLIDSTDQSDTFCPTVSRPFELRLNASFRFTGQRNFGNLVTACVSICVCVFE